MDIRFVLPREAIVDLLAKKLADDLTAKINRIHTAVSVDSKAGVLKLDLELESKYIDPQALQRITEAHSPEHVRIVPLIGGWTRIVLTMELPPQIVRLIEVVSGLSDVIYELPQTAEDLCAACGITLQETS